MFPFIIPKVDLYWTSKVTQEEAEELAQIAWEAYEKFSEAGDGRSEAGEEARSEEAEGYPASFLRGMPLNIALLRELIETEDFRRLIKQFDPSRSSSALARWQHLMRWCSITDPRLRFAHDRVSSKFRQPPHTGLLVENLAEGFLAGKARPEDLTPMVAMVWHDAWYVVMGNRRRKALQLFVQGHGPWPSPSQVPQVRIILHVFPFHHIENDDARTALRLKALEAMDSCDSGLSAAMRRRRY